MKVIDLLNKIANGEEVPEKIKWEDTIYAYSDYDKDYLEFPFSEEEYQGLFCMKDSILTQFLNDEVEIIEPQEHKIPEKLEICYSPDIEEEIFYEKGNKPNHYVLGDAGNKLIISKINEILDYLEVNNDRKGS